jgi:hypothetical protein
MLLYPLILAALSLTATEGNDTTQAVRTLLDKAAGQALADAVQTGPLFRFQYSDDARPQAGLKSCHAGQAERVHVAPWTQGTDRGVRAVFTGFDGRPIQFTCTLFTRGDERLLRCALEVTLPEAVCLESIDYPLVHLRLPLRSGIADSVVTGTAKGGIEQPSTWKVGHSVRANQPGSLAAAFGCYYDAQGGLYTAAYDSLGYRKSLVVTRRKDALELGWYHPCFAHAGFTLAYDVVLGGFKSPERGRDTDWRDAADLYKAWAVKQPWCARRFAERDDVPAWLKQGPAMVRFTRAWLAEKGEIERWFREYWQRAVPQQTPLIVAYWGWEKNGKWVGPEYFPAYPSDERFRQLVEYGRARGAHTFLWPSGYNYSLGYARRPDGTFQWDGRAEFEATARPYVTIDRQGREMIRDCTWLRGGQQARMCPGAPWTIAWLNRAAEDCCRHGAELIQIDQVVGAGFPVCYSSKHGHPVGPGPWATEVFHRQLQSMARACRAIEPDAVLGFEEPNERFIQQLGIQDYRDCDLLWKGLEPASVYSYLYHEYLPTLFQSNRSQTGYDPLALAWCLVQGQIPHLAPRVGVGPGPMVVDGSFERSSDEGAVEFPRTMLLPGGPWCAGETQIDRNVHHSGRASLKLYNPNPRDAAQAVENYEVSPLFCPGKTYRMSVWMRGSGIKRPNGVQLLALAPAMSLLESWQIPYPADASQWTRGQVDFSLPRGTTVLRVMLLLDGPGEVWLDDLKLEEVLPGGRTVEVQRPELPADHRFMQQWIALYHGVGRPYLALGRMLHPPRLETAPAIQLGTLRFAPVLHNAFEAADGSQAVVLANWTAEQQATKLTWRKSTRPIELTPGEVRLVRE